LSLCNIALCSSLFYSLTIPVLYDHVELHSRYHSFKYLRPLTVLFLTKPKFARYVRRFTLRDPYDDRDVRTNSIKDQVSDVKGVLKEAIFANSHSAKEFETWTTHVTNNCSDALLAILLPTMVRLQELDLMIRSKYSYFDRMIMRGIAHEKPFDEYPLFATLIDFMHSGPYEPAELDQIDAPFRRQLMSPKYSVLFQNFPRVRSIFGHRVVENDDDFMEDTTDVYPAIIGKSSPLTHLEFKHSYVFQHNLRTILTIPKALRTFIYEIHSYYGTVLTSPVRAIDILSALAPQCNSLENLWLDCIYAEDDISGPTYGYDHMPSFSKFSRLKNLRVAAEIFHSISYINDNGSLFPRNFSGLFPATLETLHIKYQEEMIFWEDFSGFVFCELNQVPRLKKIFIECPWFITPPCDWKELQAHAMSQGVDLLSLINQSDGFHATTYVERGWGMDGSIKWAPCVKDTNIRAMPRFRDWTDDWEQRYLPGYKEESRHFFYKWHLCHKTISCPERPDRMIDEEAANDQEIDVPKTDDEVSEDEETYLQVVNGNGTQRLQVLIHKPASPSEIDEWDSGDEEAAEKSVNQLKVE
jgi:hypothetical protein